jgi:MFS family permease
MVDYVQEYRGVPGSASTIFGDILVVSGLAATLLGGIVGDKLRARFGGSYFLVSGLAMLIGFPLFLAVLYVPFPLAWVFIFLACFSLFFNTGPTNTILANVTHPAMRAAAFALNIFVIHSLGDVISPVIIGIITDKYNMNAAFLVVGVMFLVSGLIWLIGARYLARDTELAPRRLVASDANPTAAA